MYKVFRKGQKVWVDFGCEWLKGVVREEFTDGTYLVRIRWLGLSREGAASLELRSGRWAKNE